LFRSRENNLDCIRLLMALTVIYSHCYPLGTGREDTEPMMRLSHGQTTLGTICVGVFFMISGFLISNSFLRSKSLLDYLKKRVARIYPGFLVCMILCATIVVPLAHASLTPVGPLHQFLSVSARTLILQPFADTNAFPANPSHILNGSVWSISYEFYCYILVALLGLVGILKRRSLVLILFGVSLAIVFTIAFLVEIHHPSSPVWQHLFNHAFWTRVVLRDRLIPEFLAGTVFFLYRDHIPHRTSLAILSLATLGISCFVPCSWILAFPLAGTYLVFWIGFHPRIRLHHFTRFGDLSYGTYLYAFPMQQLIVQQLRAPVAPWQLFLLAAPASLLLAFISWHGIEKWFLSARRQRGADAPILAAPAQ
jgi:peptidoglycan/LPS O-acetylase OafA/YrhL